MRDRPAILGGKRVRDRPFPPRRTMGEAEKRAAIECIESDVLSAFIGSSGKYFGGGEKVREFEARWAERCGFAHAISVNSWTTGLVTAIGAVGVEPGDEVICSPYTMSASATCAFFYGGIPVFADIDPGNFCLDPESIERCITERTKAIVVVHLFGHPADMDAILEIARPRGIKVIEDAAQAPGAYYKGRAVGAIGDVGGFSLNFHKHIHTGEGGMLVTNDDAIAHRCRLIRNHGENAVDGSDAAALVNCIGSNYRLTELQSAIGIEQLARLPVCLETRSRLAARLDARLAGIEGLEAPRVAEGCTHAYYLYVMRFDAAKAGLTRRQFLRAVAAELPEPDGFEATPLLEGYVKPLYLAPIYEKKSVIGTRGFPFNQNPGVEYCYDKGICPVAERMFEEEVLLSPLVREPLTEEDLDDLAEAMEKVMAWRAEIAAQVPAVCEKVFTPVDAALGSEEAL